MATWLRNKHRTMVFNKSFVFPGEKSRNFQNTRSQKIFGPPVFIVKDLLTDTPLSEWFSCKILTGFYNTNAFSSEILKGILQELCKIAGFRQLG